MKKWTNRVTVGSAGDKVIAVSGRLRDTAKDSTQFVQFSVTLDHCRAGSGFLAITDPVGGTESLAEFVTKGRTLGSNAADALCYIARELHGAGT